MIAIIPHLVRTVCDVRHSAAPKNKIVFTLEAFFQVVFRREQGLLNLAICVCLGLFDPVVVR